MCTQVKIRMSELQVQYIACEIEEETSYGKCRHVSGISGWLRYITATKLCRTRNSLQKIIYWRAAQVEISQSHVKVSTQNFIPVWTAEARAHICAHHATYCALAKCIQISKASLPIAEIFKTMVGTISVPSVLFCLVKLRTTKVRTRARTGTEIESFDIDCNSWYFCKICWLYYAIIFVLIDEQPHPTLLRLHTNSTKSVPTLMSHSANIPTVDVTVLNFLSNYLRKCMCSHCFVSSFSYTLWEARDGFSILLSSKKCMVSSLWDSQWLRGDFSFVHETQV